MKNQLDEMQEQQLLQIERNGCWFAFWALLAAMVIQLFLFRGDWSHLAGEWIVFMILAVYITVRCIRHGIWSRSLRPDSGTNFVVSLIGATISSVIIAALIYVFSGRVLLSVISFFVMEVLMIAILFMVLTVCCNLLKERVRKLEEETEEDAD